ncbi:MAG TPA: CARDB domain-containing protein, partial [Promineifilum sp.]|nr:CARDB domain-containing protein [Promineifilum sp.]
LYILEERNPADPNQYGDGKIALGTDPALAKLTSGGVADSCPALGAADIPANDPRPDVHCRAEHDSVRIFREQVYAMRNWMKERGQQNKPLIISEFGLLYPYVLDDNGQYFLKDEHGQPFAPARVTKYLQDTIAFLETAKDPNLGYPADGNRLVQQWLWYSIVTGPETSGGSSNLISWDTFQNMPGGDPAALTMMGQAYQQAANASENWTNLVGGVAQNVVTLAQGNNQSKALLTATFRNSGTLSVVAPIKVTFYRDQALTQEIGSAVYDPNARGAVAGCTWDGRNSKQVSVLWSNLSVGTHNYWAKIDTLNAVTETQETDNVTTRGTVTVKPYGTFIPLANRQ